MLMGKDYPRFLSTFGRDVLGNYPGVNSGTYIIEEEKSRHLHSSLLAKQTTRRYLTPLIGSKKLAN